MAAGICLKVRLLHFTSSHRDLCTLSDQSRLRKELTECAKDSDVSGVGAQVRADSLSDLVGTESTARATPHLIQLICMVPRDAPAAVCNKAP